jgi:hypothetical protein
MKSQTFISWGHFATAGLLGAGCWVLVLVVGAGAGAEARARPGTLALVGAEVLVGAAGTAAEAAAAAADLETK